MEPTAEFAQLQLGFVDRTQWRYEVICLLVLFAHCIAQQRAHEMPTHPDTVRALQRRFRQQGILGLLPENVEVAVRKRATRVPEAVRLEIDRLKALYKGSTIGNWPGSCPARSGITSMTGRSRSSGGRVWSSVKATWGCGTTTPIPTATRPVCRSSNSIIKAGTRPASAASYRCPGPRSMSGPGGSRPSILPA
jgi:hypothetical protein